MAKPTYVGSDKGSGAAGTTASTCLLPSGIAVGDLILIMSASALTTDISAAGYAYVPGASGGSAGNANRWLYKIADGTESGTSVAITALAASKRANVSHVSRGVDVDAPFDIDAIITAFAAASTTKTVPSITSTQADVMEVATVSTVAGASLDSSFTFPAGLVKRNTSQTTATSGQAGISVADSDTDSITDGEVAPTYAVTHTVSQGGTACAVFLAPATSTITTFTTTDTTPGTWTNVGGAGSIQAALSDASDTTIATTGSNPTTQTMRLKLGSVATPSSPNKFGVTVRARAVAAGSSTFRVKVVQGAATVIMDRTLTNVLTSAFTTYKLAGTRAEALAVTDWTDLYLEITATAAP